MGHSCQHIFIIITHADWLNEWGMLIAQAESAGVPICMCVWEREHRERIKRDNWEGNERGHAYWLTEERLEHKQKESAGLQCVYERENKGERIERENKEGDSTREGREY